MRVHALVLLRRAAMFAVAALFTVLTVSGCRTAARDAAPASSPAALLSSRFIYEAAPFPSAHASTIEDTREGLVAAWFGGTDEGEKDVAIWVSRWQRGAWTPPVQVADGMQPDGRTRWPCWNPVLFQAPRGRLLLFYKVGPSPRNWWGMLTRSEDGGRTWSTPERLPEGILGPVRNKPVLRRDGLLLCGSSTEDKGWRVHMEVTRDLGATWNRTSALHSREEGGLIQPTILEWPNGHTQILCRSQQGRIYESWMGDTWQIWSKPAPIDLPNPNSGIDAVMLRDGRALLVYNHTSKGRSPLNVAVSRDGRTWTPAVTLESEPGEYSYPAVIQARDGRVHITYTWKRQRIKHAVLDPAGITP